MTNEAMNMALAKWMGPATHVGLMKGGFWYRPNAGGYTAHEASAGRYTREEAANLEYLKGESCEWVQIKEFSPPNYAGDLNAIHEAEKKLIDHTGYCQALQVATGGLPLKFNLVHATAQQKCVALLRTVGLWEDKQ